MNKHFPIPVSFLQACCVVLSLGLGAFAADRPNVLFIAIDDLNHSVGALGGHPKAYTPNIDRPAERGVLFTNAHCAAPGCNPSRTAILTGLFPTTTGVYVNHDDWRVMSSVRDTLTLPEAFRKQGYRSVGAGKIYHAHTIHPDGFAGFHDPTSWDAYFPSCNRQLPDESTPDSFPANENPGYYNGFFDWSSLDIDDDAMGDGQVVQWASEQLTESHEQPLFLAVGIYRPHIPWYTPKDYFDNYPPEKITLPEDTKEDLQDLPQAGRDMTRQGWHQWVTDHDHWEDAVQAYLASATFADAMVGRLLAAFDASPMRDNTIIVLWSDHGYHLGHKQHWEKFALWEQTTRVPLIISGPNIPQGARRQTSVSLVDLYPTLAELCQLRPPTKLDGESLVPFLKDPKATAERVALITHGRNNHAVRSQHWRYIHYADGAEELYDHRQDSQERHNLANHPEHADIIVQHRTHLPKAQAPDEGYRKKKSTPKKSGEQWAIVSLKGNQQLALHALDDSLGTLTLRSKTDTNGKPASIAVAPNGRNVYVALHTSNVIASYCLEDDATLTLLNESLIGHAASYVQVHPNGRYLVSSYYGSGKAALHQIREDGSLEHKAVQFLDVASHAHAAVWDHQGHHAFVPHTRPNTITQVRFDPQSERLLPSPNAQLGLIH